MGETPKSETVVRFGVFEADLAAGELRRRGLKVRLQDRPFQILALLLGRPGQVVTREELRKTLWREDTFVDFDNSINTAINKLREALGDSAENPRFIETVGGRGYRWIPNATTPLAPPRPATEAATGPDLQRAAPAPTAEGFPSVPLDSLQPRRRKEDSAGQPTKLAGRGLRIGVVAAGATFLLGAIMGYWWLSPAPLPRVIRSVQLTHSGRVEAWGRVLIDGGRLLFLEREGNRWNLVQTSVTGGEAQPMSAPFENMRILDLSPDQTEFLVGSFVTLGTDIPLWIMPVAGGSPRRVGEVTVSDAMWFPGGQRILYAKGSDLWVVERDGSKARKFISTGGSPWWFAWSPDRRVLRFTRTDPTDNSRSLWEVAADGAGLHPLLPSWSNPPTECCGHWTPDGKYFLFSSARGGSSSIWALRETQSFFRRHPQPVQLTTGPTEFSDGVLSGDGKRLFVLGRQPQVEMVRYEANSGRFVPLMARARLWSATFSRDGQRIAYVTAPESVLWRSAADGSAQLQLTFSPQNFFDERWSPNGIQIAFSAATSVGSPKIYLVSSEGGIVRELVPGWQNTKRLDWAPDGESLVFEVSSNPSTATAQPNALYLINLKTNKISRLPGSEGFSIPRWSPAGRTIAALTDDGHKLMLFDLETRQWTPAATGTFLVEPVWSRDGKDLYFQDLLETDEPVYRLRVSDRHRERVTGCESLLQAGAFRCALIDLAPDDSPLLQLLRHWDDIYALDLDLP